MGPVTKNHGSENNIKLQYLCVKISNNELIGSRRIFKSYGPLFEKT